MGLRKVVFIWWLNYKQFCNLKKYTVVEFEKREEREKVSRSMQLDHNSLTTSYKTEKKIILP